MKIEAEETIEVVADSHWKEAIREGLEDSEIVALIAKIEAGNTFKYAVHDEMLY